jgi:hypothetical protein
MCFEFDVTWEDNDKSGLVEGVINNNGSLVPVLIPL